MRTSVLTWVICVLALVGLLAWMGTHVVPLSPKGRVEGEARVGGPFTLVNPQGKTVTDKDFQGKYMLIYFGFTHCPDECPTTLLLIENALGHLGKSADKITPVFITLDPERDTPKVMGDYVKHFGERLVGLTGSMEQVKKVADAYKVYFSKVESGDSALGYMVDHSGFIYLMGPDGKYITHFPENISEQALSEGLAEHLK